jgi:hypothetical protein
MTVVSAWQNIVSKPVRLKSGKTIAVSKCLLTLVRLLANDLGAKNRTVEEGHHRDVCAHDGTILRVKVESFVDGQIHCFVCSHTSVFRDLSYTDILRITIILERAKLLVC